MQIGKVKISLREPGNSSDAGRIEDLPYKKGLENVTSINSIHFYRNIFLQMLAKIFGLFLLILKVTAHSMLQYFLPED